MNVLSVLTLTTALFSPLVVSTTPLSELNEVTDNINLSILDRAWEFSKSVYCNDFESENIVGGNYTCLFCRNSSLVLVDYFVATENTGAFIGYSEEEKAIWVSFRGTEQTSLTNWKTNLDAFRDAFEYINQTLHGEVSVHNGFLEAFTESQVELIQTNTTTLMNTTRIITVYDHVKEQIMALKQRFPTFVLKLTGHSLGGALATIAAAALTARDGMDIHTLITFGQPRVALNETYRRRVTNQRDAVPALPPSKLLDFHHWGPEIWQESEVFPASLKYCQGGEDENCHSGQTFRTSVSDHSSYLNLPYTCNPVTLLDIDDSASTALPSLFLMALAYIS
eukprot:Awhi_evm1s9340